MDDTEIKEFLQKNPDVLREFLRKEFRTGTKWLTDFLYREARAGKTWGRL